MSIPSLRRVRSQDNVVRQLQDASDLVFKDISQREILDGLLLEDIVLDSSAVTTISHKLQRNLRGWIVVKNNTDCRIWEEASTTPSLTLKLNTSADTTISLWVF